MFYIPSLHRSLKCLGEYLRKEGSERLRMAQGPEPVNGTTVKIFKPPRWILSFEKAPSAAETGCDSTSEDEGPAPPLKSFKNVYIFNG